MKRNALVFGSISGLIVSTIMAVSMAVFCNQPNFEGSIILGYASMLIAFSFIFFGIKNYRDKQNSGLISFGQAFKLGLYIALISSSMYVATWLVEYYFFIPDFMEKYAAHVIDAAKAKGASEAELAKQVTSIDNYKELYKNPIWVILLTYSEVLPLGIVVALISALLLKKKEVDTGISAN